MVHAKISSSFLIAFLLIILSRSRHEPLTINYELSKMYPVKTPWLVKQFYSNLLWNNDRNQRCIYVTFDDGPIPIVTPFVLNILDQYNAKASFFCIGDNVNKYPDIFEQVKNAGHAIGNHTYNHLKG
jgi:peptidoglycan/xylan/chitin deacetylase (PgdA/CDA1 family)